MITKTELVQVARVLRAEHAISDPDGQRVVENLTGSLADVFAQANPRFVRQKFYLAALGRTTVRKEG